MWSFTGFLYRGEFWGPEVLSELFAALGASLSQLERAQGYMEDPYEKVYEELLATQLAPGQSRDALINGGEGFPLMCPTWVAYGHPHPVGTPVLRYDKRRTGERLCPCHETGVPFGLIVKGEAEQCPWFTGRIRVTE